jgi:hypothetical protein
MAKMRTWLLAACLGLSLTASLGTAPALAQEQDRVVVTASMITNDESGDGYRAELPYVSIVLPADFILFTVDLTTATRSQDERKSELVKTFNAFAAKVKATRGVSMTVGDIERSAPLDTVSPEESVVSSGERSNIPLVLKFDVAKGETFPAVRARAEKFIASIQVSGRVEAITDDEQSIGVSNARQHREELLRKIAEDTRLMQTIFTNGSGPAPAISLTGLGGRVKTRPSGPLEIEMYIPYSIVLGSPQPQR